MFLYLILAGLFIHIGVAHLSCLLLLISTFLDFSEVVPRSHILFVLLLFLMSVNEKFLHLWIAMSLPKFNFMVIVVFMSKFHESCHIIICEICLITYILMYSLST